MIQSLDLALTCFQLFSQPEFKQFDNFWKTLHGCDDFLEKVLMANSRRLLAIFRKTLLVASFGNNTWDLIVWNSVFVAILFWKQLLLQLLKARVTLMFGLLGWICERDFWQTCWGGFYVRFYLLVSPTDMNEAVQEQVDWES